MADSPSRNPAWIAAGAAAATIIVGVAVFAGPAVLECRTAASGFGQCLSDRLFANADIASTQSPVVETELAEGADSAPADEVLQPENDTQDAEIAEEFASPIPDFGLRVEPDGSMVVVGTAAPETEVEVYSNGELLGSTVSDTIGDWVFVPDAPLGAGGAEISVATPSNGQVAAKSFVVVINEDLSTEPLVVASTPGEASEVLQGLSGPVAGADAGIAVEEAVTSDDTQASVSDVPEEAAETEVSSSEDAAVAEDSGTSAETPVLEVADAPEAVAVPDEDAPETPVVPGVEADPEAGGEDAAAASTAAPDATEMADPAPVETAADEDEVTGDAADTVNTDETDANVSNDADAMDVADVPEDTVRTPAGTEPEVKVPFIPPSIDGIELEGDRNYFAGGGMEGATVRLYVDDEFIADAEVADGRWIVETEENVLKPGEQRVRADMLQAGSGQVTARAEVNFVLDIPEEVQIADEPDAAGAEPDVQVADVPDAPEAITEAPDAAAVVESDGATAPAGPDVGDTADAPAVQETPVVASETEDDGTDRVEPSSETAVETGMADDVAEPEPASEPAPVAVEPAEPEMAETDVASGAEDASVAAEEDEVPTLVAKPVGDPEDLRFASGKAIIRKGDNLWTIARRVYGSGVRYTTIYQANQGQIRDPDLIYPGQVFDLPEGGE